MTENYLNIRQQIISLISLVLYNTSMYSSFIGKSVGQNVPSENIKMQFFFAIIYDQLSPFFK